MLSYPSQTALLQWLPFRLRKKLASRVPCLKTADRRLPIHIGEIALSDGSNEATVKFEGFTYRWKKNSGTDTAHVYQGKKKLFTVTFNATNRRSTTEFFLAMLNWFWKISGSIERIKLYDNCCYEVVLKNRVFEKVRKLTTNGWDSEFALVVCKGRHRHDTSRGNSFRAKEVIEFYLSRKRPIGSELEIFQKGLRSTPFHLPIILDECQHLNPRQGYIPKTGTPNPADTTYPCLVFGTEFDADVAVFVADVTTRYSLRNEKPLVFRVVAKDSIAF